MKILYISLLLLVSCTLWADQAQRADDLFNSGDYTAALPLLKAEAAKGSKEAMYRLGHLYQNGLGTKRDYARAAEWYQKAAAEFSHSLTPPAQKIAAEDTTTTASQTTDANPTHTSDDHLLDTIDDSTPETKNLLTSLRDRNFFGLRPYKNNFFLPISQADEEYRRVYSNTHPNNYSPEQLSSSYSDTELEFQISLQKMLSHDLLGFDETLTLAYTQKVWWQAYSDSAPFRETNYQPEFFITVPTSTTIDRAIGLKALRYGFIHESNGQEGYKSRSWNRLYLSGLWQHKNLFINSRLWYRIRENSKYEGYYHGAADPATGVINPNAPGDDNPDIENYLGYGDIVIKYLYKQHQFGSKLRYNFGCGGEDRGAVELNWSHPFFGSKNVFWYTELFSGYGESLIEYDQQVNKISLGFSFSRALF